MNAEDIQTRRGPSAAFKWLTAINALGVALIGWMTFHVSESGLVGIILTYIPRMPFAVPSLILVILCIRRSKWLTMINMLALFCVAGPIMEFHAGGLLFRSVSNGQTLKVVSCNVHQFSLDFSDLLDELREWNPDILVFQEASSEHALLESAFPTDQWHRANYQEFRLISRYPMKLIPEKCVTMNIGKWPHCSGVGVVVLHPAGEFHLFNVHQLTPRHALMQLRPSSIWNGTAMREITLKQEARDQESKLIRQYVDRYSRSNPFLVVGDFNTPASSSMFQSHWGDLSNAFSLRGLGYGFTANCNTKKNWPSGFPWSRVDHILASSHWEIHRCQVGSSNGSDHRAVMAEISFLRGDSKADGFTENREIP